MQTFLPYADFAASAAVLDDRRLGKQRVETFQILRALTFPTYAWKNHPAVRMWRGFLPALVTYGLATCDAWEQRGFADTVAGSLLEFTGGVPPEVGELRVRGQLPPWLGTAALHVSHRSALVRKEPEFYRRFFPKVPEGLPYLWPKSPFPRWPVRRPAAAPLPFEDALALLGFDGPRPGQAEAVTALAAGRDVLLAMPAGRGGSATGVLAGLTARRPTLWIPPANDEDPDEGGPPTEPVRRADQRPADRRSPKIDGVPTARAPSAEDLAAIADEVQAEPDFVFLSPMSLSEPVTAAHLAALYPGQVVVDDADLMNGSDATAVASAVRGLGSPPVLALTHAVDREQWSEIAKRLGLRDPVFVSPTA